MTVFWLLTGRQYEPGCGQAGSVGGNSNIGTSLFEDGGSNAPAGDCRGGIRDAAGATGKRHPVGGIGAENIVATGNTAASDQAGHLPAPTNAGRAEGLLQSPPLLRTGEDNSSPIKQQVCFATIVPAAAS